MVTTMKTIPIALTTVEHVKSFVNDVTPFPFAMDVSSDRYTVNGKSIMGLFSLDLAKPLELTIHDKEGDDLSDLLDALTPYIASPKQDA